MARRRRARGFMGLGVLPVVGALSIGKLALIGGGLFAAWKLKSGSAAPAAPASASAPSMGARGFAPGRGASTVGNKLGRPNTATPAAARDAFSAALKAPIGSEQQLQVIGRQADTYLAAAAQAGILSPADVQRISSQPLAERVVAAAAQVGITPTVLPTTTLSPTLQKVATAVSAPMSTLQTTTLLRLR